MLGAIATANASIPADVNGDGKVNTADAVEVYNFILNMRQTSSVEENSYEYPIQWYDTDYTIGIPDNGKYEWETGDKIFLTLISPTFGKQTATINYDGSSWISDISFSYLATENTTITAIYAPCYESADNVLQLKADMQLGMTEYIETDGDIEDDIIIINFNDYVTTYSRLRIAGEPGKIYTATATDFIPAGTSEPGTHTYTLTADTNGNAYLYGTFCMYGTVNINNGETVYTFAEETVHSKSYALNAQVIDASEMALDELKATISDELASGKTDLCIKLASDAGSEVFATINEALTAESIAEGCISLTLPGVRTIPANAFYDETSDTGINTLNAVNLPDATEIGENAFRGCEKLKTVSASQCVTVKQSAFSNAIKQSYPTIVMPKVTTIEENAFNGSGVVSITLPEAATLGNSAFSGCTSLTRVFLPKATTLGKNVFDSCTTLWKVQLGGAVQSAGSDVFNAVTTDSNFFLELSTAQKVMVQGSDNSWTADDADYKDTEEYTNKSFLGYTFYSVTLK